MNERQSGLAVMLEGTRPGRNRAAGAKWVKKAADRGNGQVRTRRSRRLSVAAPLTTPKPGAGKRSTQHHGHSAVN
jgi:hypothetical protein